MMRPPTNGRRRIWVTVGLAILIWSILRAGVDPSERINARGWPQVQRFLAAALRPELSEEFIRLTIRESAVTLAFALLGTAVALLIGLIGGVVVSERFWSPLAGRSTRARTGWLTSRFLFAVPRSVHEVVFGLLLVNILGLNPLVAILAIGIPFGAVTAKVFAETLDQVPREAELALRAAGAGRLTAMLFGTFPSAMGDLLSYGFYRFECGIRSAAVLGIVGAGGLGFQLALSFQSLRYEQMWTFLWALIIISGLADRWSSALRRRRNSAAVEMRLNRSADDRPDSGPRSVPEPRRDRFLLASAAICSIMVPVSYWWLDVEVSSLWDDRARLLFGELVADAWPPRIGSGGWLELITDSADTIALAVLSILMAWSVSSTLAFFASRPTTQRTQRQGPIDVVRRLVAILVRFVFLVSRSVPPPVWALIVVFVLFPGLWPGAVALAIYNAGVLGRLQAEVVENADREPEEVLRSAGATATGAFVYATLPMVSGRFAALGLYRWEVTVRETVVVGVVGAAGLGRRLDEQTSAFDYPGLLATILALVAVTVIVDLASASMREAGR